jgi:hypothetical protein
MNAGKTPSPSLLEGLAALDGQEGVSILGGWQWNDSERKWVLHSRLTCDTPPDSCVAAVTDWFTLVDDAYPWGSLEFHPAKEGGLNLTFSHQYHNDLGPDDQPWRAGVPCLDPIGRILGRHGVTAPEDFGALERLPWRFKRMREWLRLAARGELTLPGEPFELPDFRTPNSASQCTFGFSEDEVSFALWQNERAAYGLAEFSHTRNEPHVYFVKRFLTTNEREIYRPSWGQLFDEADVTLRGAWLRLSRVPVLPSWQAPATWGELREVCQQQGLNLDTWLSHISRYLRDGQPHLLLIGFPIPQFESKPDCQIHWRALSIPALCTQAVNGFSTQEKGRLDRDRKQIFKTNSPLAWWNSQNWHRAQITTRGQLKADLASKSILLLGAGALGSAIGEMLIRAGVENLTVMDGDCFEIGNSVRHTLTMESVGGHKATELARRLNLISPHARVHAISTTFPPADEVHQVKIRECDIVLDCTSVDDILVHLEGFAWQDDKLFVSFSLGRHARRLFCFASQGRSFPPAAYRDALRPWIWHEMDEASGDPLPWAGIGCWHPVFPARSDDLWLMASVAVKQLEEWVSQSLSEAQFMVWEQTNKDGFAGVQRAEFLTPDETENG